MEMETTGTHWMGQSTLHVLDDRSQQTIADRYFSASKANLVAPLRPYLHRCP